MSLNYLNLMVTNTLAARGSFATGSDYCWLLKISGRPQAVYK
jgi:hypothetical protein